MTKQNNIEQKEFRKQSLIAIVGPTAIGKSEIALNLAKRISGEIISADSMQVYRELDIGTAKPVKSERETIPHHLIDIASICDGFSVAKYQRMARRSIEKTSKSGNMPILVGGSGLYIRAVIDDLDFPPQTTESIKIRKDLENMADEQGPKVLHERLRRIDSKSADKIHPNNIRRIIRALEVYEMSGQIYSEHPKVWDDRKSIYDLSFFGIECNRKHLYRLIDKRVDRMIEEGFQDEVESIVDNGYRGELSNKKVLGYDELLCYLDGEYSIDGAVSRIKKNTHHFAKRQLTWFKADPRIKWLKRSSTDSPSEIVDKLESYIIESRRSKREGEI